MDSFKNNVKEIRTLYKNKKKTKNELEIMFSEFKEKNPQLFDMICSEDCNDMILNNLLYQYEEVINGKLSQHDASVNIGQILVDKYVKPKIDK
tara:strand:+ start:135 stop:413 length:279 start_codon:yes stop_codon:yes gene_type:complete